MKTHQEQDNAPKVIQQKGNKQESSFKDGRSETVMQGKLYDMVNNSGRVTQLQSLQRMADNRVQNNAFSPIQRKENNTGLPDNLKSGIENLSGYSMDDVNVHYNSPKPAQLQAHAYAQGTDIHLGAGQEKHLPHEAWHVVQQKQGRVKPTIQMKGKVNVNDDSGLEQEADTMGRKALQLKTIDSSNKNNITISHKNDVAQLWPWSKKKKAAEQPRVSIESMSPDAIAPILNMSPEIFAQINAQNMAFAEKEQAPIHNMSPEALAQIHAQNMAFAEKEQAPIHSMSPEALAQIHAQNMAFAAKESQSPINGMSPEVLAQIHAQNMAIAAKEQAPIHSMSPEVLAQIHAQNMAGIAKEPLVNHLGKGQSSIGLPTALDASMSDYDPSTAKPLNQLTAEDVAKINQRNAEGVAKENGTRRVHTFKKTLTQAERPERREEERMARMKQDYITGQKLRNNQPLPATRGYEEVVHLSVLRQEENAKQRGFNVHDSDEVRKIDKRDAIRLVDAWILELAQASGHAALITGPYAKLSIEEKIRAFEKAGVELNLETPQSSKGLQQKFKSKLKIWQGRETEWNAFSLAIRQVSGNAGLHSLVSGAQRGNEKDDTAGANPYASTAADHIEMGSGLAMITTGFTGAGVNLVTKEGVGEIGLAGSISGVIFSLNNIIRIANDSGDHQVPERILGDTLTALSEAANIIHNTSKGLLEIGLMTSHAAQGGGVAHIAAQEATNKAAQAGLNGVALSVLGITAIIKGSIDIVQGGYTVIDSRKIRAALEKLEKEISSTDFKLACAKAEDTQRIRRNMGAAKILSGVAMVAGGAMLTAGLISNPIGWILLTAAGLISLGAAIYKIYEKSASAKKFVIKIYNMQFNKEADNKVDDAELNTWLNGLGYANDDFGSFHNEFMLRLAEGLHTAAFGADGMRKEEARKVLQTMKLKINENKKTPTPQVIAKRLRNP